MVLTHRRHTATEWGRGWEETGEGKCSMKGIFKIQGKDLVCSWLIPSPERVREENG